jgi:hypothetical protein
MQKCGFNKIIRGKSDSSNQKNGIKKGPSSGRLFILQSPSKVRISSPAGENLKTNPKL